MYCKWSLSNNVKVIKVKNTRKNKLLFIFTVGVQSWFFYENVTEIWLKTQEDCASAPNYNQTGQLLFFIVLTFVKKKRVKHVSGEEPQPSVWAVQIQRKDRRTPNPQWSRVRRTLNLRDFITLWGLTPTQAPRVYKTNSKLKQETVLVLNGYFLFVMIIIILIIRSPLFKKIHVMTSDYSYNPDEWNHWKTDVWSEYFLIQN